MPKKQILAIGTVWIGLLLAASLAHALPVWLPGTTPVATAGPAGSPTSINAMMLENMTVGCGGSVTSTLTTVTFLNGCMTSAMWTLTWSKIELDRDPLVSFAGGFQNTSGVTQDFVFSITSPVSPAFASPTKYGGQTIVTLLDPGFSGPPLALGLDGSSNPAYIGQIDGSGVLNMLASLNLTSSGSSASEVQGYPGPSIPGPAVTTSIGIKHQFSLTAGDQATFNSSFEVIPEPGTLTLLASGLGALVFLGRGRRA